jgi:hypothetical protein
VTSAFLGHDMFDSFSDLSFAIIGLKILCLSVLFMNLICSNGRVRPFISFLFLLFTFLFSFSHLGGFFCSILLDSLDALPWHLSNKFLTS